MGPDRFMWGSDYPHDEGTGPYSREALRQVFNQVGEAELRDILAGNAAKLYDFDLEALDAAGRAVRTDGRGALDSRSTRCPPTPTRRSSASSANRTRWPPPDSRTSFLRRSCGDMAQLRRMFVEWVRYR